MSGVEDGVQHVFDSSNNDGKLDNNHWSITIGRRDENNLVLKNDTFVSRNHAKLHFKDDQWLLEDINSTNGTFTENIDQFFMDSRVIGTTSLDINLMFRVGRTWLKLEILE
jgi:hypothetical protein